MTTEKSDEKGENNDGSSVDYTSISKYIKEDSEIKKNQNKNSFSNEIFKSKDQTSVEVLGSIGEGESYSESGFNKNQDQEINTSDKPSQPSEKIDSIKPNTKAKQNYLKQIYGDNNSLTVDTCNQVNKDWGKK